jgi:hypothetical protein
MEGCPLGTSGKSFEKKGPTILDRRRMPPALSAMLMNPMNSASIPISLRHISTDTQQVSMMPSTFRGFAGSLAFPMTIQLNICVSPKKKHLIAATVTAIMIKADHILLKAI